MKKFLSVILIITLFISLCSCGLIEIAEVSSDFHDEGSEKLEALNAQIQVLLALEDLLEANKLIISSLENFEQGNFEGAKTERSQALNKIGEAQQKIEDVIASPNYIQSELKDLQEKNERILNILNEGFDISEEEFEELTLLEMQATEEHIILMSSIQAFSNLYSIRAFDKLPDEEADEKLNDTWWEFGFDESIKCPGSIEEKDIYLIWAHQFSAHLIETEDFMNDLQSLREKDNLQSKESNQAWLNFMQNYIFSTQTGAAIAAPNFLFLDKYL